MTFCGPPPRRRSLPPRLAGRLTTFTGRFFAVTVRRHAIMDRSQVAIGMIISGDDVVHRVGARTTADMTNPAVNAEDALALRVPFTGKADPTVAAFPLTGSHAYTSSSGLPWPTPTPSGDPGGSKRVINGPVGTSLTELLAGPLPW